MSLFLRIIDLVAFIEQNENDNNDNYIIFMLAFTLLWRLIAILASCLLFGLTSQIWQSRYLIV